MTETPKVTTPLSNLSLDPVNVRKHGGGADPVFAGSILKRGLLYPLIVRAAKGGLLKGESYKVADGGKRLASMQFLAKNGKLPADYPVWIVVTEQSDAEARETSLMVNTIRAPTHPVDLNQAFSDHIQKDGWTKAEIAETYLKTEKEVDQILALSALSPKVREAWVKGRISGDAARSYTLGADHREQDRVLEKLEKRGDHGHVQHVRRELKADDNELGALVTFVGAKNFLAAGGKMREDLFGTNHVVLTPHVARKLADQRLREECETLVATGWQWAAPASELPQAAMSSWPQASASKKPTADESKELDRLQVVADERGPGAPAARSRIAQIESDVEARGYSPKVRAETGCIVWVDRFGGLEVRHGVQRPTEVREKAKTPAKGGKATKPAKATPAKPGRLSNVLTGRLSEQLTLAAAAAIEKDPDVAFAVLLAGFASGGEKVCVQERGFRGDGGGFKMAKVSSLEKAFALYSKEGKEARLRALARVVGASLDFRTHDAAVPPLKFPAVAAICDAINQADLQAALLAKFDAKGYFDSVDKATLLAIVRDVLGAEEVRKVKDKPKAFLAKFALTNVAKKGWLPPELRTVGYAGPGAKKRAVA